MYECTLASISINTSVKLIKNRGYRIYQYKYSQIIRSLMYVMYYIRPDIAFVVGMLWKYTSDSGNEHRSVLFMVLRYLKDTMNYRIHYEMYLTVIEGHNDAIWNLDLDNSKSVRIWIYTLTRDVVSWKSTQQTYLTHSTMESEFIALSSAGEEAKWLRNVLVNVPI